MKKTLAIFSALFALIMSSCTNDDIPVDQTTVFKINPASVVEPFTYEFNAGDLEGFPLNYDLRVRLLIYNWEGFLTESVTQFLPSYESLMSTSVNLSQGNYTAVVITDVVRKDGDNIDLEFWELSDEKTISTAKITDAGYIGSKTKILGVGSTEFSVSGSSREIVINPKPVGAILCVMFKNIHTFFDVTAIALQANRDLDYLTFNENGDYDITMGSNNNYPWRVAYIEISNYPNSTNIYSYSFVCPADNVSYVFKLDVDGADSVISDPMTFDVAAGSEYYFEINLCDPDFNNGISYGGFDVSNVRSRSAEIEKLHIEESAEAINNSFQLSTLIDK